MEFWARKTHVNDLRQSRRHVSGRAAQSRAALRATLYALVNVRRVPTLPPREERVGREPERGAAYFDSRNAPPLPNPLLRFAEEREPRPAVHCLQLSLPGAVKLRESSGRTGGFPVGLSPPIPASCPHPPECRCARLRLRWPPARRRRHGCRRRLSRQTFRRRLRGTV